MFSPLAKGNGSWDGYFDEETTFDSLFPSIYQSSIHNESKQTTATNGLTKTQEQAIHLPKTFLTRKGAILLFAKNEKQNVHEPETASKNDGKLKEESLVATEEEMTQGEKRKLFLEFLEAFFKDPTTNNQTSSNPINLKENNWTNKQQQQQEERTENVFKILSRPKSINSFYGNERQAKRQKARPSTAVAVIPNQPEQPKAHPRITSGKPRPPTRALGKLPSKNTRSEFDKEKSNFLRPPSPESHLVTTQLKVEDDRINVPRPNSEYRRSRKLSRAASSMSRYSAWWAMDDVSLSYYDNELQDHEYPECIECLSERRSEIGATPEADTPEIGNSEEEYLSQNWASKREMKEPDLDKPTNASPTTGPGDSASETVQDVRGEESYAKQPSIGNRVKSAPCFPKTNEPRFWRKAHSAGQKRSGKPTMSCSEHETVATTAMENSVIRVPSAASCYDDENEEDVKDISEEPSLSECETGPGEVMESSDIESTNQRLSTMAETSSPGSRNEVESKDSISEDAFDAPAPQTLNNSVLQEQQINSSTTEITQNTEIGDERQNEEGDIPPIVLSPEGTLDNEDKDDAAILQYVEREYSPVREEFEENVKPGSEEDEDDGITSLADNDINIETERDEVPNSPEKHHKKDKEKVYDSSQVDYVESSIPTPATNSETVGFTESLHSNPTKVQELPETVNTDDSKVFEREIHLLSGANLKTEQPRDKLGSTVSELRDSSKPIKKQEFKDKGLADTPKADSQNNVPKEGGILERTMNDKPEDKPKLDENSKAVKECKSTKVKTENTKQKKLDIQGVGKADNLVTDTKEKVEIKLQNKIDQPLPRREPQKTTAGKKAKSPKTARKSIPASKEAPVSEPSLELIPKVDENLLKMIENPEAGLELSEETLNQFAPVEDFQDSDLLSALDDKPIQTSDAFAPSKVKKGRRKAGKSGKKKGRVSESNVEEKDVRDERKRKMAEAKAKQDEELKLLKEREEEQMKLQEEAKEKQRIIEEERHKRLAQETEARRQEEEAEQDLREAKRKAKEEREKRREEEAERRRVEVKKKREEKRKRELEIQKREQELEKQRVDREQRMAELQAQKERELELERIAEEQRQEEETRRLLELEEEKRQEEARIREAEEAVQRMAREREYREQMRRIAEAQQAKLEKQEIERREKEEAERAAIEEERRRLEHEAELRENEEQERVRELRQKEAIARIRAAHEASKRRAWALRRRAQNTERMANLRFTRQTQKLTEAFKFSYHVHVPREVWELPYDWNSKKKRGSFRPKKKQNAEKKT